MLGSMIDTDEFSNMENVATLEDQLAPLFVGNSRVREIRFQQELVNLLQKNPSILEASLSIDPQQDGSFILLLIQQVFNYSINLSINKSNFLEYNKSYLIKKYAWKFS